MAGSLAALTTRAETFGCATTVVPELVEAVGVPLLETLTFRKLPSFVLDTSPTALAIAQAPADVLQLTEIVTRLFTRVALNALPIPLGLFCQLPRSAFAPYFCVISPVSWLIC